MQTRQWAAAAFGALSMAALLGAGCEKNVEGACKDLAAAACDYYQACSPFYLQVTFGDRQTCRERLLPRCTALPDLEGSNTRIVDIEACTNGYPALSCQPLLGDEPPPLCRIPGARINGKSCASDMQCASGFCAAATEGRCGACAEPSVEAEVCSPRANFCGAGMFCDGTSRCAKYVAEDGACNELTRCATGTWCDAGKCAVTRGEGAACDDPRACDELRGLYCNLETGDCARFEVNKLGDVCGEDEISGQIYRCGAGTVCALNGRCIARPEAGDPCKVDPATGEGNCAAGLECLANRCTSDYRVCK